MTAQNASDLWFSSPEPVWWFSTREIADLDLPGMPQGARSIQRLAVQEGWAERDGGKYVRPRKKRGGGVEYHGSLLSEAAQQAIVDRRPKHPSHTVGDRLRAERKRLGLSRRALAEIMPLSESQLASMERGDYQPSILWLMFFDDVAFDIYFVVTGKRHGGSDAHVTPTKARPAAREALARLTPRSRRRLLLGLIAEELLP